MSKLDEELDHMGVEAIRAQALDARDRARARGVVTSLVGAMAVAVAGAWVLDAWRVGVAIASGMAFVALVVRAIQWAER